MPAEAQHTFDRPVLFVTTAIPPDRVGAFQALARRVPIELALFGGGIHATAGVDNHGLPVHHVSQGAVRALAASGRYGAVVAGTVGRTALPAAWIGAERARVPFILWTALWAHPRSLAHLPGSALLRVLYRRADAVVTYGPHVSDFARSHGARDPVVALQAVDVPFWTVDGDQARTEARPPRLLFVGRDDPGKGIDWLLEAWKASGLGDSGEAELRLIGPEPERAGGLAGVRGVGQLPPEGVREQMAKAVGVVVPSERTKTFREPWGLVTNEAMHAGALVIASDEVGAAAGGLVRDARTGLVVPAGDVSALAVALRRAADPDAPQTRAIRRNARELAASYTHDAWATSFADVLARSVACAA